MVDIAGTLLFLFPVCLLIFVLSLDYVSNSWAVRETSQEGSGLPFVYALKTLLLILPGLLMIQGFSELVKNLLFVLGKGGSHTVENVEAL
jgi:TRAP-type mannitol/chloroaromatic compound transport system, small permease component